MDELISRQEAVDIVLEYVKKLCEPIGTPEDNEMYSYGRGLLISILLNLKHLPSAQQWVPVTEGLPKLKESHYVSGWVLCSDNEERICFGRVEKNVFGEMLWNCERDGVSGKVVAWMPLPEPYRGG